MTFQPIVLWSDMLLWGLLCLALIAGYFVRRDPLISMAWQKVLGSATAVASGTLLLAFVSLALLDSLHYRPQIGKGTYSVEVLSALDALLTPLRLNVEKTYSSPLALHAFAKEMVEAPDGSQSRTFPRLKQAGQHLNSSDEHMNDVFFRLLSGALIGLSLFISMFFCLLWIRAVLQKKGLRATLREMLRHEDILHWPAFLSVLFLLCLFFAISYRLGSVYHLLGTDKVGQDVFFQVLKSVRTALIIGLLTTLVTLPIGIALGVAAGYFRGWVDDVIQYIYTTLNSVPSVLLIASFALMMQTILDLHPEWFSTAAERADMRLLALCFILGLTSWTGLARLLRGETLKLSQLDYVQAAQAFGVSRWRILARHILPNVMHIIIIALVMDFSGLVLAEAVLSYVGIGVDPSMISFGTMINNARMELSREPVVWWSLLGAFSAMFVLVLAANLLADVIRDAFDPRSAGGL